jgi:3-hydroxybutyryl-CoA dehydrogenase
VAEDLSIKHSVFSQAYKQEPSAYFASNTSSLSINALAEGIAAPDRFFGLHFFNPAPLMPLVEIVQGSQTGPEAVAWAQAFCKAISKTAVLVRDSPGFIVNRVARPYYTETMRATEANNLSFAEADAALRSQGFKMGPFQLMDMIGLDINYNVTRLVWEGLGKPARFLPPNLQAERIEKGHLGVKTGNGFYAYPTQ